jgi:hypothetical protein
MNETKDILINQLHRILDLAKVADQILSAPDCNDCAKQECEYKPEPGELSRFNCPLWEGAKEECE